MVKSQTLSTKSRKGRQVLLRTDTPDVSLSGSERERFTDTSDNDTNNCDVEKRYSPTAKPLPTNTSSGSSSVPSLIFNLTKNIVGAGVLGLPAGIAAFGDAPSAILPALVLIALMGSMSAYGFSLVGRLCAYTGAPSYRAAWEMALLLEDKNKSSWIPALACMMVTCSLILSYSMILSRTIPDLILYIHPNLHLTPWEGLVAVTGLVLLPLCLLKDLQSLAPFSLVGISGMLFTNMAMILRYWQGSYAEANASAIHASFLDDLPDESLPHFGTHGATSVFSTDAFLLISMLSTAFSAHYNAPKFYHELKDPTLAKYNTVVATSFGASMMLMALVAIFGFLTFGASCQGLILNNYSATSDSLMTVSRFAVTLSLVCSYPLAFVGIRDGVLDLVEVPRVERTPRLLNMVTVALLSTVTWLALQVHDLRMVFALKGATFGTCTMYIFPSYMMISYCRQQRALHATKKISSSSQPSTTPTPLELIESLEKEMPWMVGNAALGFVMGCIGTYRALQIGGGHLP